MSNQRHVDPQSRAAVENLDLLSVRCLTSRSPEPTLGYLVQLQSGRERVALPLHAGTNLVGRGEAENYVFERALLRGVVEGGQWKIKWEPSGVRVGDLGSTNGSVLVPKSLRETVPLDRRVARELPGTTMLGWDGKVRHEGFVPLEPGDVLLSVYSSFVFVPRPGQHRPAIFSQD